jgi:hypothetical protein
MTATAAVRRRAAPPLLDAGLSRYEPDPIRALERAEADAAKDSERPDDATQPGPPP